MKPILLSLALALLMVGYGESSQTSEGVDITDTAPKKDAIETFCLGVHESVELGVRDE